MPRKRTRDEMEASPPEEKKQEPGLLQRIRNMWEFASVMQYIFMFGKAVKIDDDFDIEVRLVPLALHVRFSSCSHGGVDLVRGIAKTSLSGFRERVPEARLFRKA